MREEDPVRHYELSMLKAKKEIAEFEAFEKARKDEAVQIKTKHPCSNCVWGRWEKDIRFCMFPRCIAGIDKGLKSR